MRQRINSASTTGSQTRIGSAQSSPSQFGSSRVSDGFSKPTTGRPSSAPVTRSTTSNSSFSRKILKTSLSNENSLSSLKIEGKAIHSVNVHLKSQLLNRGPLRVLSSHRHPYHPTRRKLARKVTREKTDKNYREFKPTMIFCDHSEPNFNSTYNCQYNCKSIRDSSCVDGERCLPWKLQTDSGFGLPDSEVSENEPYFSQHENCYADSPDSLTIPALHFRESVSSSCNSYTDDLDIGSPSVPNKSDEFSVMTRNRLCLMSKPNKRISNRNIINVERLLRPSETDSASNDEASESTVASLGQKIKQMATIGNYPRDNQLVSPVPRETRVSKLDNSNWDEEWGLLLRHNSNLLLGLPRDNENKEITNALPKENVNNISEFPSNQFKITETLSNIPEEVLEASIQGSDNINDTSECLETFLKEEISQCTNMRNVIEMPLAPLEPLLESSLEPHVDTKIDCVLQDIEEESLIAEEVVKAAMEIKFEDEDALNLNFKATNKIKKSEETHPFPRDIILPPKIEQDSVDISKEKWHTNNNEFLTISNKPAQTDTIPNISTKDPFSTSLQQYLIRPAALVNESKLAFPATGISEPNSLKQYNSSFSEDLKAYDEMNKEIVAKNSIANMTTSLMKFTNLFPFNSTIFKKDSPKFVFPQRQFNTGPSPDILKALDLLEKEATKDRNRLEHDQYKEDPLREGSADVQKEETTNEMARVLEKESMLMKKPTLPNMKIVSEKLLIFAKDIEKLLKDSSEVKDDESINRIVEAENILEEVCFREKRKCLPKDVPGLHRECHEKNRQTEDRIQKNLELIRKILDDKRELTEKCEKLMSDQNNMEKKHLDKIKLLDEKHLLELKNLKEKLSTDEQTRREKWTQQKAKMIKDSSYRSLETKMKDMLTQHREELNRLKEQHWQQLRETEEKWLQKLRNLEEQLKEKLEKEKEEYSQRERDRNKERYSHELQQSELMWQNRLDTLQKQFSRTQTEKEEEMQRQLNRLKAEHDDAIRAAKRESETLRDDCEEKLRATIRTHENEASNLRLSNEKAQAEWREQLLVDVEESKRKSEKDLREKMRRQRDKEIEKAIREIQQETNQQLEDYQRTAEVKIKNLKERYEAEIQEVETSERISRSRYLEIKGIMVQKEEEIVYLRARLHTQIMELNDFQQMFQVPN